jgi:Tfp pilus assembly PilM family ATPase
MNWHRRSALSPIGLDIGSRQIKLAQLESGPHGCRLAARAVLDRPADAATLTPAEVQRLRNVLERQGFRGNKLVIAAPPARLACEMFELPPRSSGAPVDRIARAEIARTARLGQDTFEMAMWDLPSPSRATGATSVMAVAFKEADALSLLDPLEHDGLDVVAIDTPGWALARACAATDGHADEIAALLDVGWSTGSLVLLGNETILYQRNLHELGVGVLYREIMSQLGVGDKAAELLVTSSEGGLAPEQQNGARWQWIVDQIRQYADSLADEVRASFTYAAHRYPALPVKSLRLAGGGAAVRGLGGLLGERLRVGARTLTNSDLSIECDDGGQPPLAALLALAVGLARHQEH